MFSGWVFEARSSTNPCVWSSFKLVCAEWKDRGNYPWIALCFCFLLSGRISYWSRENTGIPPWFRKQGSRARDYDRFAWMSPWWMTDGWLSKTPLLKRWQDKTKSGGYQRGLLKKQGGLRLFLFLFLLHDDYMKMVRKLSGLHFFAFSSG